MKDQEHKPLCKGGDSIVFSAITVLSSVLGIGLIVLIAWIIDLTK